MSPLFFGNYSADAFFRHNFQHKFFTVLTVLSKIEFLIEENPSIALKNIRLKIQETGGMLLSTACISNGLKRLRITLKNATMEVDRFIAETTKQQRIAYANQFAANAPQTRESIIFIDESGFNCHLRRSKARSRENTPARVQIPTIRGRNVSLIAAMNIRGMVYTKVISISTVNTNIFCEFLRELFIKLETEGITNVWLVLDNARIHKTTQVSDLIAQRKRNHSLVFLPTYSPMLNPIEKVFSKTKFCARNLLSEPGNNNLVDVIQRSIDTITAMDCNNYYVDMTMKLPMTIAGRDLA